MNCSDTSRFKKIRVIDLFKPVDSERERARILPYAICLVHTQELGCVDRTHHNCNSELRVSLTMLLLTLTITLLCILQHNHTLCHHTTPKNNTPYCAIPVHSPCGSPALYDLDGSIFPTVSCHRCGLYGSAAQSPNRVEVAMEVRREDNNVG